MKLRIADHDSYEERDKQYLSRFCDKDEVTLEDFKILANNVSVAFRFYDPVSNVLYIDHPYAW